MKLFLDSKICSRDSKLCYNIQILLHNSKNAIGIQNMFKAFKKYSDIQILFSNLKNVVGIEQMFKAFKICSRIQILF